MPYALWRHLLFALEPERAHRLALAALDVQARLGLARLWAGALPERPVELLGLRFKNRVGLAAGLDKNAKHLAALAQLGFGFLEIGTLTPKAQPGNPPPRLFRLVEHEALINRLGFNNDGVNAAVARLAARSLDVPVGVNIGKNASTPNERAKQDYLAALRAVFLHADYVAVNVSSPNTPTLRELQSPRWIGELIGALVGERDRLARLHGRRCPIAVKLAPDLAHETVPSIVEALLDAGAEAIICSNTTVSRDGVTEHPLAREAGGLSGRPLAPLADRLLAQVAECVRGRVPLIGVGGILSVEDAKRKLDLGADLVQLYTGLIYRGPGLVGELVRALAEAG